jgi:hypothetical protein
MCAVQRHRQAGAGSEQVDELPHPQRQQVGSGHRHDRLAMHAIIERRLVAQDVPGPADRQEQLGPGSLDGTDPQETLDHDDHPLGAIPLDEHGRPRLHGQPSGGGLERRSIIGVKPCEEGRKRCNPAVVHDRRRIPRLNASCPSRTRSRDELAALRRRERG